MNAPDGVVTTAELIAWLTGDLSEQFPGWHIRYEDSYRWAATRPDWGAVYGRTASELRERLRNYTGQAASDG